jgi:hypothetical protein
MMNRCRWAAAAAAMLLACVSIVNYAGAQCATYAITSSGGASILPGTSDIGNHADNLTTPITLPFAFTFYGTNYTSANVSSNGNLQFGGGADATEANACIDGGNANGVAGPTMYPHWDDLRTDVNGRGIFTATYGASPNRSFVIEWRASYFVGPNTAMPNFEIILYEGRTYFDFIYGAIEDGPGQVRQGLSATVGVKATNTATAQVTQYSCNSAVLTNGLQLRFDCPCPPVITQQPTAFQQIVVGSSAQLSVVTSGASSPPTYRWRRSGVPLSDGGSILGSATATLTINPTLAAHAGSYDVQITEVCNGILLTTTSNPGVISVDTSPCVDGWVPGDGVPGTDWIVYDTTMWDPDGPGPLPARLVVGGWFSIGGNTLASRIAAYDPSTGQWSALGSGSWDGWVDTLAVLPGGDLVAGGRFTTAGGVPASNIARWNGSAWSALGSGVDSDVLALAVLPGGDLVAGGYFTTAGGAAANHIARWDGSTWSALGFGMNYEVLALTVLPGGDLAAGGHFTNEGNRIARWNGSVWSALGSGMDNEVLALAVLPGGDLVAGGNFTTAGGVAANYIARWNGSAWSALGSGISGNVNSLAVLPSGDLVVGGNFTTAGGVAATAIARWNGLMWSALGSGMRGANPNVSALTVLPGGDLVAGGYFTSAGSVTANHIARWNGSTWSALGSGTSSSVSTLAVLPSGDLVAGGLFTTVEGVAANYIARWNGSAWSALGSGTSSSVSALVLLPTGDLVAGVTSPGGVGADYIARWDGAAWSVLGSGTNGRVFALAVLPGGDLVAGGEFTTAGGVPASNIARWNGSAWSALGSGVNGRVTALAALPGGDLVAGGYFNTAGGVATSAIARWNGSTWSGLGSGMGDPLLVPWVFALTVLPDGDLVAGGIFTTAGGVAANYIARWNGSAWSALGSGMGGPDTDNVYVAALTVLPGGDLIAGGTFTTAGGVIANHIARWNGSAWSALGSGVNDFVDALAALPDGDLVAGGNFLAAGGNVSAYFARYHFGWSAVLTQQPADAVTCVSNPASFSVAATGAAPLSYQWQIQTAAPSAWTDLTTSPLPLPCGGSAAADSPAASTHISVAPCPGQIHYQVRCVISNACGSVTSNEATLIVNTADFNGDGDIGTDADIEAYFGCLGGNCCPTCGSVDFNADGDVGTDADIEAFFRVLAGGTC